MNENSYYTSKTFNRTCFLCFRTWAINKGTHSTCRFDSDLLFLDIISFRSFIIFESFALAIWNTLAERVEIRMWIEFKRAKSLVCYMNSIYLPHLYTFSISAISNGESDMRCPNWQPFSPQDVLFIITTVGLSTPRTFG